MRKLLKRWYVWLGLVLLLGLAGSVVLTLTNPSRITQENFDRIQYGMPESEIEAILGLPDPKFDYHDRPLIGAVWPGSTWSSGPDEIVVSYTEDGKAKYKAIRLLSLREMVQWYAKKGAEKIGVKWD